MIAGRTLPLALVVIAAVLGAQEPAADTEARLASIEAQRALWRTYRAAAEAGDAPAAAAACVKMLDLAHPVPPPGRGGEAGPALRGLATTLWSAFAARARTAGREARKRAIGEVCPACTGRGVLVCDDCKGRGFREVQVSRRIVRRDCPPYRRCEHCGGCGRAPGTAAIQKDLEELTRIVDREQDKRDPVSALRGLHRAIRRLRFGGLRAPYGAGARLARIVPGRAPVDASTLDNDVKKELKAAWERVTGMARLDFLRATALEAAGFVEDVTFLEPEEGLPRGSKVEDAAEPIPPDRLRLDPAGLVGRFVRVDVEVSLPPDKGFEDGFPFVGVIPVKEVDPDVVRVFACTRKDRERLDAAGRTGLAPWARKLVSRLPRELPLEADVGAGSVVTIYGRMLARENAAPPFALEVWVLETR